MVQKQLALNSTSQLHDPAAATAAAEHFQAVIQDKTIPSDLVTFSTGKSELTVLEAIKLGAPEFSNSEVRRLLDQNSVSLFQNQSDQATKLSDPNQVLNITEVIILKVGKKRWFKIAA
jgi:tyrosyl-tRNA synthetase